MERTENIGVLLTKDESKRLRVQAAIAQKTVSSFVRDLLLEHSSMGDDSFFAHSVPSMEHSEPATESISAA